MDGFQGRFCTLSATPHSRRESAENAYNSCYSYELETQRPKLWL